MGSIFRLYLDGRIPEDNPFTGNKNNQPEVWSYGHRNPQGQPMIFPGSVYGKLNMVPGAAMKLI